MSLVCSQQEVSSNCRGLCSEQAVAVETTSVVVSTNRASSHGTPRFLSLCCGSHRGGRAQKNGIRTVSNPLVWTW